MNYSQLAELLQKILAGAVPSKEVAGKDLQHAIHFWGDDSEAWMFTEGEEPIHFKPSVSLGPSFSVTGVGVESYSEFIRIALSDKTFANLVDTRAIAKLLQGLLREYFGQELPNIASLAEIIKEHFNNLKARIIEWDGFAPTQYLALDGIDDFQVGRVKFVSGEAAYKELIEEFNQRIDSNASNPETKEATKQGIEIAFANQVRPSPLCARVTVKAEETKVKQVVEEEAETAICLLRSYTSVLFPRTARAGMGLLHELSHGYRPVIAFSKTDESWTVDTSLIGVGHNFILSNHDLQRLKSDFGFNELSAILAKISGQRTKLEKLIVTSIRWLGRGVAHTDVATKVLHFAAACENLIMGQQMEGEISEKFSRRIAFLLGDTPEERRNLYLLSKKLYNQRSKVIHSGSTNIDANDVAALEGITLRAIVRMAIRPEWSAHTDFVDWYNEESFGSSTEP